MKLKNKTKIRAVMLMAVATILFTTFIPMNVMNVKAAEGNENTKISWDTYKTLIAVREKESHTRSAYSAEDMYLLAQTIDHEAGLESIEGQVAVAEVVKNRLASDKFPDTVSEVIYAPTQFSKSDEIPYVTPTALQLYIAEAVLNNKLLIFDNKSVLFFKNPQVVDGIPATENVDWGPYEYYVNVGNHAFYTYTE